MVEWESAVLTGLFTGIGVIMAQRLVNFIDHHPIFRRVSEKVGDVINFDIERDDGTKKKRGR